MEKNVLKENMKDYYGISAMIKNHSYRQILESAADIMDMAADALEELSMGGYSKGGLSGAYQYVLKDLMKNINYYDWLYGKLEDEVSRQVFTNLIRYRIVPQISYIKQAYDSNNHQYFDMEFVHCGKDEVFVDCGGYTGETTLDFIRSYKEYRKIYVYEPSESNLTACRENLEKYADVEIRNCGVGEKSTALYLFGAGSSGSFMGNEFNGERMEGEKRIDIVSLDEDIHEPITFIKMDIEGFEIPALLGAKKHIRNDKPKLAVCTYHVISDMWEIPKLIDYINADYRFYIRHYMETENWETVLYAIPKEETVSDPVSLHSDAKRRVVSLSPHARGWSNVELIKDCGLVPYLLYKNHNCEVTMVGAKGGEYSYLERYVCGIKMEFLADGSEETRLKYIEENAERIDCLILRGCYPVNFNVAKMYKFKNPKGKIYLGLDANSNWMDRIIWDDEDFMGFMECCDVRAASSKVIQEHLNVKWPWRIEHIPNGTYIFNGRMPDFAEKENIIMTAARLGTVEKANHMLTEAFALVAEEIPEWKLKLVGSTESVFLDYLEDYYRRFPQLRDRVLLTGPINDRESLYEEYAKAKIFALTSICEGGTPNVIGEALNFGCVVAVTKIDAYAEAIDDGNCGLAADIGDIEGFADILLKLCKNRDFNAMYENALHYGKTHFNMEKIVAKLNGLLFGGEDGEDCS